MHPRIANILEQLERSWKKQASVSALPGMAVRYLQQSASASLFLRACDRVGPNARVTGRPRIDNRGRIEIGERLRMTALWNPVELATGPNGVIEIGDGVAIHYGTLISAEARVRIGHRAMIGNFCIIADTEVPGTREGGDRARDLAEALPIEIGDGAWLAVRVTVLPGTTIGAGSVITAGSVVSGNIPPGVVAGGIPARVLRTLHGDAAVEAKIIGGKDATPNNASSTNGTRTAVAAIHAAIERPAVEHRGVLIADFTIDELGHHLQEDLEAPGVAADIAPFGQIVQALLQPPSEGRDFAVVWTRPDTAIPSFSRLSAFEAVDMKTLLAEVDAFCDLIVKGASAYRFVFVPTWTLPPYVRGLGLLDGQEMGAMHALAAMNLRLMDRLARAVGGAENVHVLNAQRWTESAGKAAHSPKLWYLGKVPFHGDVFVEAARDLKAALRALTGGARKLLVLDLDDTMWGGIVGDAGWENLRLGGHDALGESFVDFQRAVKALTRRGVVLGIVSKNEESTALEAIRSHPEMVLREGDFVGWRINWRDKAQNIVDLAADLNLGLQSVVFIDDNPVERARVRDMLPEVLVPEWPEDKLLYKSALLGLRCFDTPSLSKEDAERTQLYAAEKQRDRLQQQVGSIDEWLKSLQMKVLVEPLGPKNLQRAAQLLNKTNQMNASTRRLTEAELLAWTQGGHGEQLEGRKSRHLFTLTVRDKFGDAGLTGIVSLEVDGKRGTIVDFVLSCRVMGRKVENTMLHLVVSRARSLGVTEVEATVLTTAKNKPCLGFFKDSGFVDRGEQRFTWDATEAYALPAAIELEVVG